MVKRIRQQTKEGLAVSLGRLVEGVARSIGGFLGFVAEMERQGKSEHIERGEVTGKTASGKEYRGAYGFHVKVGLPVRSQEAKAGLNPEEFREQKKLSEESSNK